MDITLIWLLSGLGTVLLSHTAVISNNVRTQRWIMSIAILSFVSFIILDLFILYLIGTGTL